MIFFRDVYHSLLHLLFCGWLLLFSLPAHAAAPPLHAWYSIHWSGLHIADLVISLQQDDKHYTLQTLTESRGLVWTISRYYNYTTVQGDMNKHTPIPRQFSSHFQVRKDTRHIAMRWSAEGTPLELTSTPPEKRWKRPEVPISMRTGALDAQSMGLALLNQWLHARPNLPHHQNMTMFDGRRLSDMRMEFQPAAPLSLNQRPTPGLYTALRIRRLALAGYTDNELERQKKEEPVFVLYLPVAAQTLADAAPPYLTAKAPVGKAIGLLERLCATQAECLQLADIAPPKEHQKILP